MIGKLVDWFFDRPGKCLHGSLRNGDCCRGVQRLHSKTKHCHTCGTKLNIKSVDTYDPQTGKPWMCFKFCPKNLHHNIHEHYHGGY